MPKEVRSCLVTPCSPPRALTPTDPTSFADADGNQQQLEQIAKNQKDFDPAACNLGLCKGFQFADVAPANVQAFTAGQVVPIKAEIKAPHPGVANVSVVDTATNAIIGEPLLVFDEYSKGNIPANNTAFEITMPDVAATCGTAGACVVQWWWDSEEAGDAGQTYMSCIDFTM